ncbi:Dodecin, Flavin-binding [Thermogutta terrifontis]|uniref:Dodecin, Flavin-binding n=2 Tax=Thermogutta terrifontis TaxID=1331910 RepID=A0A286RFF2_9BACT|nr:Dodecin, Flavin-binding [Thermogutta terrifontis]
MKELAMADAVYKKIQLVGTSTQSFSDAVAQAVKKAATMEKNPSWFEVVELRGSIADGKVAQYQVTVNIGCRIVDEK